MIPFAKETIPISLEDEMRHAYLDYAMSVIVGRALPDVRDGLKPVHRRVLYAMHELGNDWNKAYKKSARIVGDVIGKYHPHGDQSVYDTIVRMAQDFSLRYMLVDGQGNFGSVDGDSAAAMRYTEIRMAKIGHELLADIDKETVDFGPNYDGSEKEPLVLPSRIPNLLINGSGGIAVGMATNIPPHNLSEVVDACQKLLAEPDVSIDELIKIVPAPDFPTAGLIYGLAGVQEGYRTGRGRVIMRARTHHDTDADGRLIEQLIRVFDTDATVDTDDLDGPTPIFILGLPRSGTTLLERILGTHSQVASAGELTDLPKQLRWTADRHGHALLDDALLTASDSLDYSELGRRYLSQTQWRAQGRRFYVDKLPPNWMLVGHLRRALPRAKVLHLVREPMDVCFSNWRALFGDAYAYSYDFESLARHHAQYHRLMAHWHRVHPGFVLDVPYADLVNDTETICRRVLAFCGQPFEADCLDHTRNRSSVSTLSSAQVREPIHARGIGEWRRYATPLEPLRRLLEA